MNQILKILIVIAIIAALATGGYILFRSFSEQRELADVAGELGGQATGLGTQAADYVKGNIPTIVAAGGTATALGGVALSKINSAKQQVTDTKTAAENKISGLVSEKDKIASQLETVKTQLTDKEKQISEITERLKGKELELADKAKQLEFQVTQNEALTKVINNRPLLETEKVIIK